MNILLIDNYDSFTYNLSQLVYQCINIPPTVIRNNCYLKNIDQYFDAIIFSPGPGLPAKSGYMNLYIKKYHDKVPMLGICLGHQAIAEVFGAQLHNVEKVFHGVESKIFISKKHYSLFRNIPSTFSAGRYHSWIVSPINLPHNIEVTCYDNANMIMGICHKKYPLHGLQFHPESVMCQVGKKIINNFISLI